MAYNIFFSFTSDDELLARRIVSTLNNAFTGHIEIFFSPVTIKKGSSWKKAINDALKDSHAIMSLITPQSYAKPWVVSEFFAFWLQEKDAFVLKYGEIDYSKLFTLFNEYQDTDITIREELRLLVQAIGERACIEIIPYRIVDELLGDIKSVVYENDPITSRIKKTFCSEYPEYEKYQLSPIVLGAKYYPSEKKGIKIKYNVKNNIVAINGTCTNDAASFGTTQIYNLDSYHRLLIVVDVENLGGLVWGNKLFRVDIQSEDGDLISLSTDSDQMDDEYIKYARDKSIYIFDIPNSIQNIEKFQIVIGACTDLSMSFKYLILLGNEEL